MKPFLLILALTTCITFSQVSKACNFCQSTSSGKAFTPPPAPSGAPEKSTVTATAPLGKTIAAMDSAADFFGSSFRKQQNEPPRRENRDTFSVGDIYQQ